ncbi:MAG TPA: glutamate synthase-related protein, partial [Nocardioidaceae bacterium]|nr:glutamate synthase-related protein [Nocardioidaceae bacterium]
TDHCPTGVATQKPWLVHGLDPELKSVRCANYIKTLRRDLLRLSEAVGVAHPGLVDIDDIDMLNGDESASSLREVYGYQPGWGGLSDTQRAEVVELMSHIKQEDTVGSASH